MAQLILAIETSQQSCGVAIRATNDIQFRQQLAARQHATLLLPMIKALLTDNGLSVQDLDAIAFGCGPGSFTGARIAASVAQGLAFAANTHVIPVSSMQALAHSHFGERKALAGIPLFVVLDAHMGEYYAACYRFDAHGYATDTLLKDSLLSAEQLACELSRFKDALLLGNGVHVLLAKSESVLSASLVQRLQSVAEAERAAQVNASSVLQIAEHAWHLGKYKSAEHALPVYLRERTAWKTVEQQNAFKPETK